mgnify:CR=1 FL=1
MYQQIVKPKEENYLDPEMVKAVFAANGRRTGKKLLELYGKSYFSRLGKIGGKNKADKYYPKRKNRKSV